MSGFKNIGVSEFFKRYGYRYGIKRALFSANPIHIVKDYENKKILYYKKVEKTIKRKYAKYSHINPEGLKFTDAIKDEVIWVYWRQGLDNAPDLVKMCIASIVKYNPDKKVCFVTEDNYIEYLTFPQYIIDRLNSGRMSVAAFSDLLRVALIEHYGGFWIDATVMFTGPMPEYIEKSDFFVFQDRCGEIDNPAVYTNWFFHAKPGNPIALEIRNMLFAYWKRENYVIEYLFAYIIIKTALENHPELSGSIPYATSDYSYLLFNMLDEPYDVDKYKHVIGLTNIHKLTYKLKAFVYTDEKNVYNNLIGMYNYEKNSY